MICKIREDWLNSRKSNDVALMVLQNNKLQSAVNKHNVHYDIKCSCYIHNALRRIIGRFYYIFRFYRKIHCNLLILFS